MRDSIKQYVYWLIGFVLIIIIGICFSVYYYQEYIKPESFTIGSVKMYDYVPYELKTYFSEGDVLFSQDISDYSFLVNDNEAVYEYQFGAIEFDADNEKYLLFVNSTPVGVLEQSGNIISGYIDKSYFNSNNEVLDISSVHIQFSAQTKNTTFKLSLDSASYPYLKSYMNSNNFVVTLVKSPYMINGVVNNGALATSTLTIQYNDGINEDLVVEGYEGMIYTLIYPNNTNYSLDDFEIVLGNGSINGNLFTFGAGDTIIKANLIANFEEVLCIVEGNCSFGVTYNDVEQEMFTLGSGIAYECGMSVYVEGSDSVVLTDIRVPVSISVDTDGTYTIEQKSSTSYEVIWLNASHVNIDITRTTSGELM